MNTQISSESDMIDFGQQLARELQPPLTIELVGDVGAGKTTLTRGLAQGFGITEPLTSPSFTISKQYAIPATTQHPASRLVHYDFYRLSDPGLMQCDLAESVSDPQAITVVEWADTVANLLPIPRLRLHISLNPDGTRLIKQELLS